MRYFVGITQNWMRFPWVKCQGISVERCTMLRYATFSPDCKGLDASVYRWWRIYRVSRRMEYYPLRCKSCFMPVIRCAAYNLEWHSSHTRMRPRNDAVKCYAGVRWDKLLMCWDAEGARNVHMEVDARKGKDDVKGMEVTGARNLFRSRQWQMRPCRAGMGTLHIKQPLSMQKLCVGMLSSLSPGL